MDIGGQYSFGINNTCGFHLNPMNHITYEGLFDRAVAEYKNPWALLSKRLQPIICGLDQTGYYCHFWGFLLKSLYGEGFKYRIMSFVHEKKIIQGDLPDWLVDSLALSFGNQIVERLNDSGLCRQQPKQKR